MLNKLKDLEATESNTATFTCTVDSSEYSGGKWLYNDREVAADDKKFRIRTSGKTQELQLANLTREDSGRYAYVTGNDSKTEAKLYVSPVTIVEPLRNVVSTETASVEMKVVMSHEGVRSCWFKNGQPLQVRKFWCVFFLFKDTALLTFRVLVFDLQ